MKHLNVRYINSSLLFGLLVLPIVLYAAEDSTGPFGVDTSIEGMRSQQFSVSIFYFLVTAIFIFLIFIFMFMLKAKAAKLKTGEKWLFAWLILGVVVAIVFGATQMLHGYLF
jgi:hypothetical protein